MHQRVPAARPRPLCPWLHARPGPLQGGVSQPPDIHPVLMSEASRLVGVAAHHHQAVQHRLRAARLPSGRRVGALLRAEALPDARGQVKGVQIVQYVLVLACKEGTAGVQSTARGAGALPCHLDPGPAASLYGRQSKAGQTEQGEVAGGRA